VGAGARPRDRGTARPILAEAAADGISPLRASEQLARRRLEPAPAAA
jgi:hypothetical protein